MVRDGESIGPFIPLLEREPGAEKDPKLQLFTKTPSWTASLGAGRPRLVLQKTSNYIAGHTNIAGDEIVS